MFYTYCGPRRSRWDWEAFAGTFWGPGRRRHARGKMGRMFDQGDLKYVILRLLEEKPRHGYEIIKALEEKSGGSYSPSPGTVYPTLTMLEEMGYARSSTAEEGGKRVYEITPEGRQYLAENVTTVDSIFERITRAVEPFFDHHMLDIHDAMRKVGRATYATAMKHSDDKVMLSKIAEILGKASAEIDALTR
jgi:DNA-binding PadR family transcriptional regulator